jgi:DNA-directed RNA polymerase specialized sigma24 family protein
MGRRRKQLKARTTSEEFKELDTIYRANDYDNEMVTALNSLPTDERSMMILYISTGCNKTKLAKQLNCSWPLIAPRITKLQNKLKEIIEKQRQDGVY